MTAGGASGTKFLPLSEIGHDGTVQAGVDDDATMMGTVHSLTFTFIPSYSNIIITDIDAVETTERTTCRSSHRQ